MGWQAVDPVPPRARPAVVAVSMFKPPSVDRLALRMRLGRDPVKAAGFSARETVAVLWGDGDDVGMVLLRPDPAGRSLLKVPPSKTGALECLTRLLPPDPLPGPGGERWSLAREVRKSAEGRWRVADGGLVVGLPAEWWIVEGRTAPGPRGDPNDPKLQEMATALLSRGCTLPELRARLRLDEAGFKVLCELLRRGAADKPRRAAVEPEPRLDPKAELARIRRATSPPERADLR